jgi:hypothetical protein
MERRSAVSRFALVGLCVGLAAFGIACSSTADLQHKIEQRITPGTSLGDIRSYVSTDGKKLGMVSSGDVYPASQFSDLKERGVAPDTPALLAGIPGNPLIQFFFLLDKDHRFDGLIVVKVYTGP